MCFLLQLSKFVIVLFAHSNERKDFSVGSLKFVIKELSVTGNLALAEGAVRWDMMCRFIGYHREKSAVIMMGIVRVIGLFLVCYGMHLRCSFYYYSRLR